LERIGTSRDNAVLHRSRAPRRPRDEIVRDDVTICGWRGVLWYGTLLYVTPSDVQNSEIAFMFWVHLELPWINKRKSESWHPLWSDNLTFARGGPWFVL